MRRIINQSPVKKQQYVTMFERIIAAADIKLGSRYTITNVVKL